MKLSTKNITRIAIFAALTAVSAFFSLPIGPVPITLQTLVVVLSGMFLGANYGAFSQLLYILIGLTGIPIFAGMQGGIAHVLKPSFGFLIGFILAAYLTGKIFESNEVTLKNSVISSLVGVFSPYLIGIPYMYFILNVYMGKNLDLIQVLNMGLILFIIGDSVKVFIASVVAYKIVPMIKKMSSMEVSR